MINHGYVYLIKFLFINIIVLDKELKTKQLTTQDHQQEGGKLKVKSKIKAYFHLTNIQIFNTVHRQSLPPTPANTGSKPAQITTHINGKDTVGKY